MQFLKDNKIFIGVAAVAVVGIFVYFTYFSGGASSAALLTTTDDASQVSPDILATLASLHTIQLDNSIFQDPVFLSLTDFGVQIPPENVGRRNPFAPITGSTLGN